MIINHNMASLNTYRQMSVNESNTSSSLAKLSSGLRINKAGDDAAGLAISEKMRGQIRGLDQATRNAQDGISLIQTAEGSLNETHSILQRMKELATQSANDTNTDSDRGEIQKEMNQLTSEINRIGNSTEFNTKKLLNGNLAYSAATAGKLTAGATLASSITITDTAVAGAATAGAAVGGAVTVKDGTEKTAGSITGDVNITGGFDMTALNNELTVTVGTTTKTISMATHNYTDATGQGFVDYKADLQSALDAAFSGHVVEVGDDATIAGAINATAGTTVSGKDLSGNVAIDVTTGDNELTFKADGVQYTISITEGTDYTDANNGATAGAGATKLAADLQAAIQTATGGTETVSYSIPDGTFTFTSDSTGTASKFEVLGGNFADTWLATTPGDYSDITTNAGAAAQDGGYITLTAVTAGEDVSIGGGNMMGSVFSTVGDGSDISITEAETATANNTLTFDLDGASKSITLATGTYADADALVAQINTQLSSGSVGATATNDGGKLVITSNATGASSTVTAVSGSAATALGFDDSTTYPSGANGNNQFQVNVDGVGSVTATLQNGTYSDMKLFASAVQSAINTAQGGTDVSVAVSDDNKLVITSGSTGASSRLSVSAVDNNNGLVSLGMDGSNTTVDGVAQQAAELQFQIGANNGQFMAINVSDMRSDALGISSTELGDSIAVTDSQGHTVNAYYKSTKEVTDGTTSDVSEYALDVSTSDKASAAISVLDSAISSVSAERSKLGAYQNRLEHTISNLGTSSENLTAAESRIRDVDMAKEMMNFQKNNILQQAAQAMLAQANQQPQGVLQLLR